MLRKLYMNGTACHLEIFSLPQAIENSRQFFRLRTDILQKTIVGCPWKLSGFEKHNFLYRLITLYKASKAVLSFGFVDKNSTTYTFQNLNVHWLKGVLSMTKFVLFLQGGSTPVKGKSRILSTFAGWDWLPNAAIKQIENLLNSFWVSGGGRDEEWVGPSVT